MASGKNSEKKKKIVVLTLFGAMIVVAVYEVFWSGPTPRPKLNKNIDMPAPTLTSTSGAQSGSKQVKPSRAAARAAVTQEMLSDLTPLDLPDRGKNGESAKPGWRGSIFAQWVPPPPPPPKQPDPPPITLQSVQPQTAVAGTPRPITIQVYAAKIPPDGKVYFNGQQRQTKRISDSQLQIELSAQDYAQSGTMNVEVKSASDPALFSNSIPFISQPAPLPPFKYVGRLGDLGVFEMAGSKDIKRAGKGGTLQGSWRIDSISDAGADVTQTQYDIRMRVPLQEKGK